MTTLYDQIVDAQLEARRIAKLIDENVKCTGRPSDTGQSKAWMQHIRDLLTQLASQTAHLEELLRQKLEAVTLAAQEACDYTWVIPTH